MDENAILRRQVEELRQTVNLLSRAVNAHTAYLGEYRAAHNELFKRFLYWFMMWLRPVTLPMYKPPKPIRLVMKPDDVPTMLPGPLHNEVPMTIDDIADNVFEGEFGRGGLNSRNPEYVEEN